MSIYLGNTPLANTGYDKANTSLSNLTSTGKNIANWSNNVTNCITEIPQDIKLELNNGTLTLKAGSKVYVPNGAGVFDAVVINTDKVCTYGLAETGLFMVIQVSNQHTFFVKPEYITSGTTAPTVGDNYRHIWYDTANNIIKMYAPNSSDYVQASFPIALCTSSGSDGKFSSINQVFNGFGYIGSTVFALPGVKGLIPNGRNTDGTLKNSELILDKVLINTDVQPNQLNYFFISKNSIYEYACWDVSFDKDNTSNQYYYFYDKISNTAKQNAYDQSSDIVFVNTKVTDNSGKIIFMNFNEPFHALDYSDSPTISGWGMPSERYIDLTLGASPATYTAPANGYFAIASTFNQNGILFMYSNSPRYGNSYTYNQNAWTEGVLFVKKGYSVNIQYNGTPSLQYFRFIYAEGEQ